MDNHKFKPPAVVILQGEMAVLTVRCMTGASTSIDQKNPFSPLVDDDFLTHFSWGFSLEYGCSNPFAVFAAFRCRLAD
jgi:hypothetical protein